MPGHFYGMTLIVLATASFSLMSLLVRLGSESFRADTFVFTRCVIQAACLLPLLPRFWPKAGDWFSTVRIHFLRGGVGIFSMWLLYFALGVLPLALTSLLSMSSAVWATVLGWFFLGEKPGGRRLFVAALVCAGFVVVLWPAGPGGVRWEVPWLGAAAALACGFSMGTAQTLIRQMRRTRSTAEIVFWMGAVGALLTAPSYFSSPELPSNLREGTLLLLTGVTALAGQALLTSGFRYLPTLYGSLGLLCGNIWNLLLGFTVLGEIPPTQFWVGLAIVATAGTWLMLLPQDGVSGVSKTWTGGDQTLDSQGKSQSHRGVRSPSLDSSSTAV